MICKCGDRMIKKIKTIEGWDGNECYYCRQSMRPFNISCKGSCECVYDKKIFQYFKCFKCKIKKTLKIVNNFKK